MALATGVEAPSSAVAQLGQLDHRGKVHFGRVTLWLTLGIVAWLTVGTDRRCGTPARRPAAERLDPIAEVARGCGG